MVDSSFVSSSLIKMIESVSASESRAVATLNLLKALLELFKMDQASLYEKDQGSFNCLLAIDSGGKILQDLNKIFSSVTLLDKALMTMEPIYWPLVRHDEKIPVSIKDDALKQVFCLPLTRAPGTAIFLGSRQPPQPDKQNFSESDLDQFKVAARASWLAIQQYQTQENLQQAQIELKETRKAQNPLLYHSPNMENVLKEAERISPYNISVLLSGESGVGKEEVARFIHRSSQRTGAFIAINCANLSESLLESELFGYKKGAFTGAVQNKEGLFKAADGGTIFLDEIAEIPFNLQAKLLRSIQEKKIRPVGGEEEVPVDVRLISATHQDLEKRIQNGEFRADLYYRIQDFVLKIPPLRERAQDIEVLAKHFVHGACLEMNLPPRKLSKEALDKMLAYSWKGNVRELKSVCRTAVILAFSDVIQAQDLRLQTQEVLARKVFVSENVNFQENRSEIDTPESMSLKELSRNYEKQVVRQLLEKGLNQVEVAARLGISVRTLQRILNDSETHLQDPMLDH